MENFLRNFTSFDGLTEFENKSLINSYIIPVKTELETF